MARKDNDKDETEGFLSRWSQRKRAVEEEDRQREGEARLPGEAGALRARQQDGPPAGAGAEPETEIDPADLPDIDSLGAGDDFSVFMKKGVPEALQRQALRKLWRLNPIFGHLDRLNDYDLDYTNAGTVVENLKTIYKVGKGMVLPEEEEAARKTAESEDSGGQEEDQAAVETEQDATAPAAGLEAPASEPLPAVPTAKSRPRNPGDPVVSAAPTRRAAAPRSGDRSALRRRWGDSGS